MMGPPTTAKQVATSKAPPVAMEPNHAEVASMEAPPEGADLQAEVPGEPPRSWTDDSLTDELLQEAISKCKTKGIELELRSLARRIAPSDEYKRASQRCVALLKSAVAAQWGPPGASGGEGAAPVLEVCGSLAQGTEIDGAEIDLAVRAPPGS